jgi:hypothetical protein
MLLQSGNKIRFIDQRSFSLLHGYTLGKSDRKQPATRKHTIIETRE